MTKENLQLSDPDYVFTRGYCEVFFPDSTTYCYVVKCMFQHTRNVI